MATSSGTRVVVADGGVVEFAQPGGEGVVEQSFGLQGLGEQDSYLDAGGLRRQDGGDPLAGDQIDDGIGVLRRAATFEL